MLMTLMTVVPAMIPFVDCDTLKSYCNKLMLKINLMIIGSYSVLLNALTHRKNGTSNVEHRTLNIEYGILPILKRMRAAHACTL
jgi:hypothetical protein